MIPPILITTCTKSKSVGSRAFIPNSHPLFETQSELIQYWVKTVGAVDNKYKIRAKQLYTGKSFKRALLAIGQDISNLHIISAGLGLIKADEYVVPYELTTSSAAPNRIGKQIAFGGFDPEMWWAGINAAFNNSETPIADLVRANLGRTVVLCMSKEYARMVMEDINTLAPEESTNLRIVGNSLDELLPIKMFDVFIPYDHRMNGSTEAMPGSQIDFGIRAAIHFITKVLPIHQTLDAQKCAVTDVMVNVADDADEPVGESRKVTDEEIMEVIAADWSNYGGRKVMLLRVLREHHKLKCSQTRFDKLYEVIKSKPA